MIGAIPLHRQPYLGARPFWATLRAVRLLPDCHDDIWALDLIAHEHRPDPDGVFPAGKAVVIERAVRFIWRRGEVYNERPFGVQFAAGEQLLPYMSACLADGTVVAVGSVRPAQGNYSDQLIQAAGAAIVLTEGRRH